MKVKSLEELISKSPRRVFIEENIMRKAGDIVEWSLDIVNNSPKSRGPYLSLDFSGPSHFKMFLVDGERKEKISRNYTLRDVSLRIMLATMRAYLTNYKFGEWADVYDLKLKASEMHKGVNPSKVNHFLKMRGRKRRIFERNDDRVRMKYPVNELILTEDCIYRK